MHQNIGVGSWIARRAHMTPDRVALIFENQRWTYRELSDRITRLARALDAHGIGRGDRVAFLGTNHPAALEVLFASGLLGAIAVPMHPGFDDDALDRVLKAAEPKVLVATPELIRRVAAATHIPLLFVTGEGPAVVARYEDLVESASNALIDQPIELDDPLILAFSSGTTGRNKGALLSHRNVLFNALNVLSVLDYASDDVILTSAPLYRMGGLGLTLPLLLKGGTSVLQERADPEVSLRLIEQHRVTIVFDGVGPLERMTRSPAFWDSDLSSLRISATGGSTVPVSLVDAFRRRGLTLQPGYGLTEASPLALLVDRDEVDDHPGAVGRPPMFTSVRVVGPDLANVDPGTIGELLVKGPNVMLGYWRDPEATARALTDDGWLRTGDAAWTAPDGTITVVGRMVDTLTFAGRQIHPGPLEAALAGEGVVLESAVVQNAPGATPHLFVVPLERHPVDRAAILDRARAHLAVLPELHVVEALPKNPNGKILRTRLRDLVPEQKIAPPKVAA